MKINPDLNIEDIYYAIFSDELAIYDIKINNGIANTKIGWQGYFCIKLMFILLVEYPRNWEKIIKIVSDDLININQHYINGQKRLEKKYKDNPNLIASIRTKFGSLDFSFIERSINITSGLFRIANPTTIIDIMTIRNFIKATSTPEVVDVANYIVELLDFAMDCRWSRQEINNSFGKRSLA